MKEITDERESVSTGISAIVRSVLVLGRLSKSLEIKILAQLNNNLAPKGKSRTFKIVKVNVSMQFGNR